MSPSRRGCGVSTREALTLLLIAAVASFLYNYNSLVPLDGVPDRIDNDYSMSLWNLWHVTESLCHLENPFITTKIYYPIGANLTTHPLTSGFFPLTVAIKFLSANSQLYPLYAYKAAIWICYVLLLVFGHLFLRELGYSQIESFIPAFTVTFSNFCLGHVWHLNIISGFFVPLSAYLSVKLYHTSSRHLCIAFAGCLGLAIYFTEFSLFIYISILFLLGAYLIIPSSRNKLVNLLRHVDLKIILLSLSTFLVIIYPFLYFFLRSDVVLPDPSEANTYSANLAGFFIPDPTWNAIYDSDIIRHINSFISIGMSGREVFFGFPFIFLALIGIFPFKNKLIGWPLLILAGFFFILSLGPRLIILQKTYDIILPFSYLRQLPVLSQLRTPVRLIFFSMMLSSAVAAEGIRVIKSYWKNYSFFVTTMVAFSILIAIQVKSPIKPQGKFHIPSNLAEIQPGGSVVALPVAIENDYLNMLYQIFHHQPIAYGYLARRNLLEIEQRHELEKLNPQAKHAEDFRLAAREFKETAQKMGITNIIITDKAYNQDFIDILKKSITVIDINQRQ